MNVFDTALKPLQNIVKAVADDTMTDAEKLDEIRQLATDGVVDVYAAMADSQEASDG